MENAQMWSRCVVVASLVLALGAAGCVPTPTTVPAPDLPAGIGVSWVSDSGGSLTGDEGLYAPEFDRFSILDDMLTGPTPAGPYPSPVPPPFIIPTTPQGAAAGRPDGTAGQPWNGFAGEGITLVAPDVLDGEWSLDFPGGNCRVGYVSIEQRISMVSPSPDGTLVAVNSYDLDSHSSVEVMELVDGTACPLVARADYSNVDNEGEAPGNVLVWAPDSTAIVYSVRDSITAQQRLVRLDAASGALPADVVAPTTDQLFPLGWSVADRLLFSRIRLEASGTTAVSRLVTRALDGGAERVIDVAKLTLASLTRTHLAAFAHFGYFIPGTTGIVYNDGSSRVSNADGYAFPRFYVALIADAANAGSRPLLGSKPPVTVHQEALASGPSTPPFALTDVPNVDVLERFVR